MEIKIDSKKALEILNEIIGKIDNIDSSLEVVKKKVDNMIDNNTWTGDNALVFKEKAIKTINGFDKSCGDLKKDITSLISSINEYENVDKKIINGIE